jgi:uncharacterized protein
MSSPESADRTTPAWDCQACGACCASPWKGNGYVVVGDEEPRLRRLGVPTVTLRYGGPTGIGELVEKLAMVRDEAGRFVCTQFDGPIGGPCSCRIYEERPQPCRRLEVGSAGCRDARRRLGFPA